MTAPPASITLRGISKHYTLGTSRITALNEVTLTVNAGELLALTGPSGSGKSTLLNIAGLIDRPDSGELFLGGQPMAALDESQRTRVRRRQIGFIFQSFNLIPVMTVAQNVDYPLFLEGIAAGERRTRVARQLEAVGLEKHARHRPDELSGGQRQRVAIARALIKRPTLVVADEPTASLDSATADQVLALMREQCHTHGAAFLIATHDERLRARCDRVLTMKDGEIS